MRIETRESGSPSTQSKERAKSKTVVSAEAQPVAHRQLPLAKPYSVCTDATGLNAATAGYFLATTSKNRDEPFEPVELDQCIKALRAMEQLVERGDLRDAERMLLSQANTLNTIFTSGCGLGLAGPS